MNVVFMFRFIDSLTQLVDRNTKQGLRIKSLANQMHMAFLSTFFEFFPQ